MEGMKKMLLGFCSGAIMAILTLILSVGVGEGVLGLIFVALALTATALIGFMVGYEERESKLNYRSYLKGFQEGASEKTIILKSEERDILFKIPNTDDTLIKMRKERRLKNGEKFN